MIYIIGDTHIPMDIQKLSSKNFPQQKNMIKTDYVIICGDFGGVWNGSNEEKYWLKWLENKNFTTLFIDGNHENFEMINSLPTVDFCGGVAHKVNNSIYHLMRGEIYTIDNNKIFTFGGAYSHDKDCRTEGKNWWHDEMPSDKEYKIALQNLETYNFCVDYIITHSASTNIQQKIAPEYEKNKLSDFLEIIQNKISYKKWFFGHYHKDINIDEKNIAVFNVFSEI